MLLKNFVDQLLQVRSPRKSIFKKINDLTIDVQVELERVLLCQCKNEAESEKCKN